MRTKKYETDKFKDCNLLVVREYLNKYTAIEGEKPSLTKLLNAAILDFITTHGLKSEFERLNNQ
jgi:hypothetical protein